MRHHPSPTRPPAGRGCPVLQPAQEVEARSGLAAIPSRKRRSSLHVSVRWSLRKADRFSPRLHFALSPRPTSGICHGGTHTAAEWSKQEVVVQRRFTGRVPGHGCSGKWCVPGRPKARRPTLVMESTYGNRQHPTEDPRPKLAEHHPPHGGAWRARLGDQSCIWLPHPRNSSSCSKSYQLRGFRCIATVPWRDHGTFSARRSDCTDETCRLIKQYGSPSAGIGRVLPLP